MTADDAPSQPVSRGETSKKNNKHGPRAETHCCSVPPARNPVKKVIADYVAGAISALTGISVDQTLCDVRTTRVDETTVHLHVQHGSTGETYEYVVKVSERPH